MADMMFFEVIRGRRTARQFKPTPVSDEHLRQILDAARLAPTSGNQQPWKFLVVRDQAKIARLQEEGLRAQVDMYRQHVSEEEAEKQRPRLTAYIAGVFSAPVYVVVLVDKESKYPDYNIHDGPLAAANLILAARALGYGTIYATDTVPGNVACEVLGIPERYTFVCLIPVGVPEAWPDAPPKKTLEDFIVWETFAQGNQDNEEVGKLPESVIQ